MTIPGLSTLKSWGLAIAAAAALLFYALFQSKRAELANDKLEGEKQARDTENKATEAMIEGLENEQKNEDIDPGDIDRFYK